MSVVFILTGPNAVGKTTLGKYIQREYKINVAHTRALLKAKHNGEHMHDLTNKYARESKTAHLEAIKEKLLSVRNKNGLIIEGPFSADEVKWVYHLFSKDVVFLVYITADERVRLARIRKRHNLSIEDARKHIEKSDNYRNSRGLEGLRFGPDIFLENNRELERVCASFEDKVKNTTRKMFLSTIKAKIRRRRPI